MNRDLRLLVVDDDAAIHRLFRDLVGGRMGVEVSSACNGEEGVSLLRKNAFDAAVVDLNMPVMGGMEFIAKVRTAWPELLIIVFTGEGSIQSAVEAMKAGAIDYLTKPFKLSQFQGVLGRIKKIRNLEMENVRLRRELGDQYSVSKLVGHNPAMRRISRIVDRMRFEDCSVVITGESGTGKELVARALHYDGKRGNGPFVPFECGSVQSLLLESELFGHVKGAFTDADSDKTGLFEKASGGTLFLDEVAELPIELQPLLLRVLEEGQIRPVGGTEPLSVDVRIIAATHKDLMQEVEAGRFRKDLFYRLNVVHVDIPPLRERKDDIPLLVSHFVKEQGFREPEREALFSLMRYEWPGNVREMINVLECASAMGEETKIGCGDLPPLGTNVAVASGGSLKDLELREILRLLEEHRGDTGIVSEVLGINRSTLYRKIRRYRIDITRFKTS